MELKSQLKSAITRGEIIPFYQPMMDLQTEQIAGFEVLARWRHPERGLLLPDKFMPLIEDMRLMSHMTLELLRQVIADAREWPEHYRLSLNVSPTQLADRTGITRIAEAIAASGMRPSRFEIEITEAAVIEDLEHAQDVVEVLRALGISLALDDFGTGYSSIRHLRAIPFDKLKIDKSFTFGLSVDPKALSYIEAMINLARILRLEVTAEGIENDVARQHLVELGCGYGQGYLYSRPVHSSEIAVVLDRLDPA